MSLWVCRRCSTRYAVGLSKCPQCTSEQAYEEGTEDMGKSTVLGGTTATDPATDVTYRVNDDGTRGDPIHEVTTDEAGPELVDLPEGTSVKPAPKKTTRK